MQAEKQIAIHEVAYHRNGIGGEPFYVCRFTDPDVDGESIDFIATVFAPREPKGVEDKPAFGEPGWLDKMQAHGFHNPFVAVLALNVLPEVAFGVNSWRGDKYADAIYRAIEARA